MLIIYVEAERLSPNPLATYAPWVTAVAVLIVGLVAAHIAWRQWITARTKVQLDLYDKRHPVFVTARALLQEITRTPISDEKMNAFTNGIADARFLFDDRIVAFLKALRDRAYAYQDAHEDAEHASRDGDEKEREVAARERRQHRQWLREQYAILEDVFAPYLQLEDRKSHIAGTISGVIRRTVKKIGGRPKSLPVSSEQ